MTEAFFGKRRPGVFLQQFHEAQDMAQRRAQIVGDGITERFQFLVGGLQLRRAFDNALLQLVVQLADFLLGRLAFGDVGADGHVLARFALIIEEGHDGRIHPVKGAVLGLVLDFAMPDPALRDGRPKAAHEFFWVMARIDDAVILTQQLFA